MEKGGIVFLSEDDESWVARLGSFEIELYLPYMELMLKHFENETVVPCDDRVCPDLKDEQQDDCYHTCAFAYQQERIMNFYSMVGDDLESLCTEFRSVVTEKRDGMGHTKDWGPFAALFASHDWLMNDELNPYLQAVKTEDCG
jgi:hypothetical protein